MTYSATVEGRDYLVDVEGAGEVLVNGIRYAVDLQTIDGQYVYSLLVDNESYELFVEHRQRVYYVFVGGDRYAVEVEDERLKRLRDMGGQEHQVDGVVTVTAPMPGLVVRVLAEPGQVVQMNQGLVILEAMKMENEIRTPRAGVVKRVNVKPGQTVGPGEVLAVVGDEDEG